MRNFKLILFLFVFSLCSCKSEFDEFNQEALSFASDKKIDQKEYESLVEIVSGKKGFQQFKDQTGKVDNEKIVSYLLKYFKAKKNELQVEDIWQPAERNDKSPFNINVFLENSASMDGYVKGVTQFETAIYNLLGDLKISGLCDSLNLSYINKYVLNTTTNALAPDIQDFIEKLEPSTFQKKGGDRTTSDIKNILNTVLKTVNEKNVALLISDFVFSPGKQNTDAEDYLNNQGVGIKIDFAQKRQICDLSVVVIQLESGFDGKYFNRFDRPVDINCKRPYYIWIMGSSSQVKAILNKKIIDHIKGGYLNRIVYLSIENTEQPAFKILSKPTQGSFDRDEIGKGILSNATPSQNSTSKGLFGFQIAADFSKELQDGNYFMDTLNYQINDPNYRLKIESLKNNHEASLVGFTHLLTLQTSTVRDENLNINVIGTLPTWVLESNSIDDSNILIDDLEKRKTFGIKQLVEAINDVFYPPSNSKPLNTISITIKK